MATALKSIVSKKKLRYVQDGFNLDLSYINERIIAMGFPADSIESFYRNSAEDVKKFLDTKHKDHYKIYNLCSEKNYDSSRFHNRVAHYPFDDHHPPNFQLIKPFCEDVKQWLRDDPLNVAVVHCKAGKGRTGVMICCYLLHSGEVTDAQCVLDVYGQKRTFDAKGVTIPSQRRYIHYYDRFLRGNLLYTPVSLYLRCIVLDPVPTFGNFGTECNLNFVVKQRWRSEDYESKWFVMKRTDRQFRLEVDPPLLLRDDVKFEFMTKPRLDFVGINPKMWRKSTKEFHFWLNTFFVDAEMDGGLAHDILGNNQFEDENESPGTEGCEETSSDGHNHNPSFTELCNDTKSGGFENHNDFLACGVQVYTGNGNGFCDEPSPAELVRRLSENATIEGLPSIDHFLPEPHHQTVVGVASLMKQHDVPTMTELLRLHSLAPTITKDQQVEKSSECSVKQHVNFQKSISNGSSSSSSSVSLSGSHCTQLNSVKVSSQNSTVTSFNDKRTRHASVPQTASSPGSLSHMLAPKKSGHSSGPKYPAGAPNPQPIFIDGTKIALRLKKSQIDKAFKDKMCKVFSEDFNVTLFMTKPRSQSDDLFDYCPTSHQPVDDRCPSQRRLQVTPVPSSSSGENLLGNHPTSCPSSTSPTAVSAPTMAAMSSKSKSKNKSRLYLNPFMKRADSSSDEEPTKFANPVFASSKEKPHSDRMSATVNTVNLDEADQEHPLHQRNHHHHPVFKIGADNTSTSTSKIAQSDWI